MTIPGDRMGIRPAQNCLRPNEERNHGHPRKEKKAFVCSERNVLSCDRPPVAQPIRLQAAHSFRAFCPSYLAGIMRCPYQRSNGSEPFPVFDQFHAAHGTHPFAFVPLLYHILRKNASVFTKKYRENSFFLWMLSGKHGRDQNVVRPTNRLKAPGIPSSNAAGRCR